MASIDQRLKAVIHGSKGPSAVQVTPLLYKALEKHLPCVLASLNDYAVANDRVSSELAEAVSACFSKPTFQPKAGKCHVPIDGMVKELVTEILVGAISRGEISAADAKTYLEAVFEPPINYAVEARKKKAPKAVEAPVEEDDSADERPLRLKPVADELGAENY